MFHALIDLDVKFVDNAAIDRAFELLMQPANRNQFETWRQRLSEQFTASDAAAAKQALLHLCQHPNGRTREEILDSLMAKHGEADPAAVEDQLARLLQMLQRDGYLLEDTGVYGFRSFLLREYWHRREVR